jgi:protein-L-isoaspartate(D-aspartate) O-methyltransferase
VNLSASHSASLSAASRLPAAQAAELRHRMVQSQLQTVGFNDGLLMAAFELVPREAHLPASLAGLAYADAALEVAPGRFLLEPMVLALLLQHAGVSAGSRVLVVGAATGYSAAIAAAVGAAVTALEDDARLLPLLRMSAAGYDVAEGPLVAGWAAGAPFDVIIFEGAIEQIPPAIAAQLAPGGCAAAVIREDGIGHAKAGSLVAGRIVAPAFLEVAARPLPGFARRPEFAF